MKQDCHSKKFTFIQIQSFIKDPKEEYFMLTTLLKSLEMNENYELAGKVFDIMEQIKTNGLQAESYFRSQ